MSVFLSFTVLGIVSGAVYGILAIGPGRHLQHDRRLQLRPGRGGHGGRVLLLAAVAGRHWPFLLAIVVIVFMEAPLLAIVVEFVLFRRIHGATVERSLMVSLGLLVILLGVATIFWSSPDVIRSVPPYFTQSDGTVLSVRLFGSNGVTLQYQQIMFVVVTAVVGLASASSCAGPASASPCAPWSTIPSWSPWPAPSPTGMSQTGWVSGSCWPRWPACSWPRWWGRPG